MSEVITVVMVDDDQSARIVHAAYLAELGEFSLVAAPGGAEEAVREILVRHPGLILLDLDLGDGTGLDVLAAVREAGVNADVMMITASGESAVVDRALAFGVVDYLVKPFSRVEFQKRLQRYAREKGARGEAKESLNQGEIDRRFAWAGAGVAGAVASTPKGVAEPTLELVRQVIREAAGPLSAQEIAELAGISKVSARRYLAHLAQAGQVQVRPRYGQAGRPEHLYTMNT